MQTRPLGASGIEASVVGLGTWGIGGWMWGGADEQQSIDAMHAAIDHGVNLIDTAPIYGFGWAEVVTGNAIKDRRDKVVLATKCGMVTNTTSGREFFRSTAIGGHPHGHLNIHIYLSPDSIRDEVHHSLKRLRTDYIDLMQTHWQEETTPREDTMNALLKLKDEGKIRAIGVSNATTEQMDEYRAAGTLDTDQEKYSMLDRDLEQTNLPYVREHGMAMLAYSPLALGALTGKITADTEFNDGDLRKNNPRFTPENLGKVQSMLDAVRRIAERHGLSVTQVVIAWTVAQPGVSHALVGARSCDHAEANAQAGGVQLSDAEIDEISKAVDTYDGQ
jgi:aryl-alcohol dehydrogenase-like predicted oxidoreductase